MIIRILSWLIVSSALLYAELGIEGWVEGTDYDPSIPTYAEVLGYAPGEALTTHREMLRYLSTLAAASDRVVLETYGESYQGRELAIAVVSSPDNLASIEQIYTDFQLLVDPRRSGNRERIIENRPVAVYLVYSIHGDEHSCTEAALLTAYHLAADRSEATRDILENTIIVIDPLLNPDGRMRYLGYLENTRSFPPNPDPNAVEHNPYPIGGRTNHYLFDLNRDWFAVTQQESRARVKQVQRWRPQVLGSYHEMGYRSSYYFAPPAEAVNKNFSPIVMKWLEVFGRENARAFDQRGWRYFTKEIFDSFYPGYGDSWPILNGVVAMTFEQASAEGSLIQKPDGHLLTLREAIEHHFVTGITT
ncbi:MAG: peptidase M14, partial [Fidelibacterota bacterium]